MYHHIKAKENFYMPKSIKPLSQEVCGLAWHPNHPLWKAHFTPPKTVEQMRDQAELIVLRLRDILPHSIETKHALSEAADAIHHLQFGK
jgi:hypothetical protein